MLSKASDYLSISQNQSATISIKKLNERVKEMEQEVKDSRIEHQVELTELNTKYAEA